MVWFALPDRRECAEIMLARQGCRREFECARIQFDSQCPFEGPAEGREGGGVAPDDVTVDPCFGVLARMEAFRSATESRRPHVCRKQAVQRAEKLVGVPAA